MPQPVLPDVFSADEVARAAGVPRQVVARLVESGDLPPVEGTSFFTAADAVRVAARLRTLAVASVPARADTFFTSPPDSRAFADQERRVPAVASGAVHAVAIAILLWATAWPTESASNTASDETARLVFLVTPGPGGGGGGGGTRHPQPAPHLERRGVQHALSVPAVTPAPPRPVERAQDPLPSRPIVAPVVNTAADTHDREGVIEQPRNGADSRSAGDGGGNGTGTGTGNGEGTGSGIGAGAGGGTGGGPYRPGSGIDPPRLLHEVKAQFTDEARRQNVSGDVVLEIVVTRDGAVGDVKVLQGLGAGLDERAIAAVRQWQFAPARRQGQPVDVIVEVAVEFTLK